MAPTFITKPSRKNIAYIFTSHHSLPTPEKCSKVSSLVISVPTTNKNPILTTIYIWITYLPSISNSVAGNGPTSNVSSSMLTNISQESAQNQQINSPTQNISWSSLPTTQEVSNIWHFKRFLGSEIPNTRITVISCLKNIRNFEGNRKLLSVPNLNPSNLIDVVGTTTYP